VASVTKLNFRYICL